ncbi:MAG: hypothetical protein WCP14_00530 [bacterium]
MKETAESEINTTFGKPKSNQELILQASESHWHSTRPEEQEQIDTLLAKSDALFQSREAVSIELLAGLEAEARELGLFTRDKYLDSRSSDRSELINNYKNLGMSDYVAEMRADEYGNMSYVANLRRKRAQREREISKVINSFIKERPLKSEFEKAEIAKLDEITYDLSEARNKEKFAQLFPGGNFLIHTTEVTSALKILESGALMNTCALDIRESETATKEDRIPKRIKANSGYEGISWNLNQIGALPGDRFHLVGLMAAPKDILGTETQLTIPSRPAPYELIQIEKSINPNQFYDQKNQYELQYQPFTSYSVRANLIDAYIYNPENEFSDGGPLKKYIDNLRNDPTEELRSQYEVRNGHFWINPELVQQESEKQIAPGAVYLQFLLDTGRLKSHELLSKAESVADIFRMLDNQEVRQYITNCNYTDLSKAKEDFEGQDSSVGPIEDSLADIFILVPRKDKKIWQKMIVASGNIPKGIIVYNDTTVRLEDFASKHEGDMDALTGQLSSVIKPTKGYLDYEQDILGREITDDVYTGHAHHVLKEGIITYRPSLDIKVFENI